MYRYENVLLSSRDCGSDDDPDFFKLCRHAIWHDFDLKSRGKRAPSAILGPTHRQQPDVHLHLPTASCNWSQFAVFRCYYFANKRGQGSFWHLSWELRRLKFRGTVPCFWHHREIISTSGDIGHKDCGSLISNYCFFAFRWVGQCEWLFRLSHSFMFFWFHFLSLCIGCVFCMLLFNFVNYVFYCYVYVLCCYVCSVLHILFSSCQLALFAYPDWGFFLLFPQLQGKCQGITRKDGARHAIFPN